MNLLTTVCSGQTRRFVETFFIFTYSHLFVAGVCFYLLYAKLVARAEIPLSELTARSSFRDLANEHVVELVTLMCCFVYGAFFCGTSIRSLVLLEVAHTQYLQVYRVRQCVLGPTRTGWYAPTTVTNRI